MLDGHNIFNADMLESSFFDYATKFILKKEQGGTIQAAQFSESVNDC